MPRPKKDTSNLTEAEIERLARDNERKKEYYQRKAKERIEYQRKYRSLNKDKSKEYYEKRKRQNDNG